MIVINPNPPIRPACCPFSNMAELFATFDSLLVEVDWSISSSCGHKILLFDHHFFHLASVSRPPESVLSMPGERNEILSTVDSMGRYQLGHRGSRARNLPSAMETMKYPDEVWVDNPIVETAKWVYVKQFDSKPYPYTIAHIGERPCEGGIVVPFSSFPCKSKDLRKWRQGVCMHPKQIQPPEGGCI